MDPYRIVEQYNFGEKVSEKIVYDKVECMMITTSNYEDLSVLEQDTKKAPLF